MPRKKQGPRRLDEDEQRAANFVMGEDVEDNLEINRDLTKQLTEAPAAALDIVVNAVEVDKPDEDQPSCSERAVNRMYNVVFDDDDEDSYHSSEDEDFHPEAEEKVVPKKKKSAGKASKQKTVEIEKTEKDKELEGLLEDADINVPILVTPSADSIWHSPIGNIELEVDLERSQLTKLELPGWDPCFQIYLSQIPGRSIVYFERFKRKPGECEYQFDYRKRKGNPDDKLFYYIKDVENHEFLRAFGLKQNITFLKYHKHSEILGTIELKICIHANSLVELSHPSEINTVKVPVAVKHVLNSCFNFQTPGADEETEKVSNHDIDLLYDEVKKHHNCSTEERRERVEINPQHSSLIPRLRRYQADAVRWMLEQERYQENLDPDLDIPNPPRLHPLYKPVVTHDGTMLFYSPVSGYLVKEMPEALPLPLGGILADEMGLGKTVEILSLMLSNPRLKVPKPKYLEPIQYNPKKKKSRRRRTPSPVEFYIKDDEEEDAVNIAQVDGGDTGSSSDEEDNAPAEDSDDDFEPSAAVRVKPRQSRRNNKDASKRVFSDKRTVYYHEDFDSLSSDDEVIPKPSKRKTNKRSAEESTSQPSKRQKVDNRKEVKGPKVINTLKKYDDSHPIFSPFKGGKFSEKSSSLYDQIVKSVQVLGDGKKATDGVNVKQIKSYLEKQFKRNIQHKQFTKKLNDAIAQGVDKGQIIKTNIGKVKYD